MKLLAPLIALGLVACSGTQPYREDGAKNLMIRSELRDVSAALHVHEVAADCKTTYRGTVPLDRPEIEIAMPAARPAYLIVTFDSSSFLSGSRSTNVRALVEPRAGYRYELRVRYRDSIYDVALREIDRKGASRELPRRDC